MSRPCPSWRGGWSACLNRLTTRSGIRPSACASFQRSEEHTSELQSRENLVCRLLLEKKKGHQRDPAAVSVVGAHRQREPCARRPSPCSRHGDRRRFVQPSLFY